MCQNRSNNRVGDGPSGLSNLSKRSSTCRPIDDDQCCKFNFTIFSDKEHDRFFFKGSSGNPMHNNHLRLEPKEVFTPLSLMKAPILNTIHQFNEVTISSVKITELIKSKHGELTTPGMINYVKYMKNNISMKLEGLNPSNPVDLLLYNMRQMNDIKYVVIYHKNVNSTMLSDYKLSKDQV